MKSRDQFNNSAGYHTDLIRKVFYNDPLYRVFADMDAGVYVCGVRMGPPWWLAPPPAPRDPS